MSPPALDSSLPAADIDQVLLEVVILVQSLPDLSDLIPLGLGARNRSWRRPIKHILSLLELLSILHGLIQIVLALLLKESRLLGVFVLQSPLVA